MARHWEALGAQRLHVVDLDGARDGVRQNAEVIRRLVSGVGIPVQVGGGIRALDTARALLGEGVDRVVIGTAAAEHPEALGEWVEVLAPERMIVGVDARGGRVATHGWQTLTDVAVLTLCVKLAAVGIRRVLYTDVARDGRLVGPDVEGTRQIATILAVIGSGGVATVEHLQQLAQAGAEGAIVGTALYEGRLALSDALGVAC
jgi:phosphoribosylformimino-5-aminoimidazole carboxamide ribotide isomerase